MAGGSKRSHLEAGGGALALVLSRQVDYVDAGGRRYVLTLPREAPPGAKWVYKTSDWTGARIGDTPVVTESWLQEATRTQVETRQRRIGLRVPVVDARRWCVRGPRHLWADVAHRPGAAPGDRNQQRGRAGDRRRAGTGATAPAQRSWPTRSRPSGFYKIILDRFFRPVLADRSIRCWAPRSANLYDLQRRERHQTIVPDNPAVNRARRRQVVGHKTSCYTG
jgi:hypothetical protein